MKQMILSILVLTGMTVGSPAAISSAANPYETYFGATSLDMDMVFSLHNPDNSPCSAVIRRYFKDGTIIDSVNVSVPGQTTVEVRLSARESAIAEREIDREKIIYGQRMPVFKAQGGSWVRVTGNVAVSAKYQETLTGDIRHEADATPWQEAYTWTPGTPGVSSPAPAEATASVFINLEDHPVILTICMAATRCIPGTELTTTVAPHAMVTSAVQPGYRMMLKLKTKSTFLWAITAPDNGSYRKYATDSSVTFDSVK